jgi:hypothetical protein
MKSTASTTVATCAHNGQPCGHQVFATRSCIHCAIAMMLTAASA